MIDTHSHIYAEQFDADREEVVRRAIENGVTRFIMPAVDSQTHKRMFDTADLFTGHYPAMGLHPTSVKGDYRQELAIVKDYLTSEKERIVAIGEVGLDYYWDRSFEKEQDLVLRQQLDWAIEANLPVIIHVRDAFPDIMKVAKDYKGSNLRMLFHAYSGTVEEAEIILSLGRHLLGIGGVVTFKKSELYKVVQAVGLDHIVLETDAPYLTPVPHRGQRNESGYTLLIATHIASLMDVEVEKVGDITTTNAIDFFKL